MGKFFSTIVTVVVAVGASAGIWILANLTFNQARRNWTRFNAIIFAGVGFLVGALLAGNHITIGSPTEDEGGFLSFIWLPVALAVGFAALGMVLERIDEQPLRVIVSTAAGAGIGILLGFLIREAYHPELKIGPLIGWTVGTAVVGGGISALRKKPPLNGAITGAAIGWLLGGWGMADIGSGLPIEAVVATVVPTTLIGFRFGHTVNPDALRRASIDRRSRAYIFLGPALLFIFVTLVIPTIRTIYLSLLDKDSEEFVGIDNYSATFQDRKSWNATDWANTFTSRLFIIGAVLLVIALISGRIAKQRTGRAVELGNPTIAPLLAGCLLVLFAAFSNFRGTIVNNLWWVVTVVVFSTSMGLAVAVLADRSKNEKLAKSMVFMPLAISNVGAAIIWRFMYVPRDASVEQTGTLNALWVGLGRLSTGSGIPTYVVMVLSGLALIGLLVVVARALTRQEWGRAALPGVAAILLGWFFIRYIGPSGVGGVVKNDAGVFVPNPVGFIQEQPFNNMWLMVILIWLQTGFAMVILSAAIKAVPDELLEAARVDGATQTQVFWRITLPQIASTIGVVVTTLIVVVMKVFDIVKVVTNGNYDTQVLANDMYNQAFQFGNTGRGAALAVILFISVLPVMIYNIRRMQREG